MPFADAKARFESAGDIELGIADRGEWRFAEGEIGGDCGRKGAAGAVRILGVDAFAFDQGTCFAVENEIGRFPVTMPTLNDDVFRPEGGDDSGGFLTVGLVGDGDASERLCLRNIWRYDERYRQELVTKCRHR